MKGNIGEWSELYVLLKLLSEGKVYGADKELNQIDDIYYDILKMIRTQTDGLWEYERSICINIINQDFQESIISIPISEFRANSELLLMELKSKKASKGSFEIIKLSDFVNRIKVSSLKAKSSDKADIFIKIHDFKTGSDPTLGFSIKSMLGSPSTLLNAGGTTNFLYELVDGIDDDIMNKFNLIFKSRGDKFIPDFRSRFKYLHDNLIKLNFVEICNSTFKNNLVMIDSYLPNICSWLLLEFYNTGLSNCIDTLKLIYKQNPMEFDISSGHLFYHYKFKKLLSESALGMLPGTMWSGIAHATGGYLIVREDGDVLCYHLYNRNEFEEYLLMNTRFETPSTSRYGFGSIYKVENKYFIKLNMQIRFIK